MLAQFLRPFRRKPEPPPAPPFPDHAPDEPQERFRAFHAERNVYGYGSRWSNGDVAIQWAAGPSTLIAAHGGEDWTQYVVDWVGEY